MAAAVAVVLNKRKKALERELEEENSFSDGGEYTYTGQGGEIETECQEDGYREDADILRKLTQKVKESEERKANYGSLAGFMAFLILYMAVLYLQQQAFKTYQVASAHRQLLPPDTFTFSGPGAIYDWLNTTVIDTIFQDPDCGDGLCSYPEEFPGFGRFGCKADCGLMQNVTAVTVRMTTAFESEDDQAASSWNLCLTYPAFLCWFEEPKEFTGSLVSSFDEVFSIPDGSWDIVINAPRGGVEGQVDTVKNPDASQGGNTFVNETVVFNSWGSCKPRNESRLELCRRTCASFAVCTALACDNIGQHDMANIAGDCYKICNEDANGIIEAYANSTCYDVACALNDTASFLSVYKDFTYCHPDPAYDGRSSFNGLQGLSWTSKDLTGFTGTPKPAHEQYCKAGARRKLLSSSSSYMEDAVPGEGVKSPQPASRRELAASQVAEVDWSSQVLPDVVKAALNTPSNSTSGALPDPAPWLALGANTIERMETLQVALLRSLYQWPKEPCTCPQKYYLDPARTGQKLVAFFCSYLGGPTTLPACNYTHPGTGRQLTTLAELNQAMAYVHQKLGLIFAQDEEDAFLGVLLNNLAASASLPLELVWVISNRLHQVDASVVNREWPPACNTAYTMLNWRKGVDYETQIWAGSTVEWVWADDDPHSIREVKLGKGPYAEFQGVGSGKLALSRTSKCGPDNSGFLNVTQPPPVPCTTVDVHASDQESTFSYAWEFNTPGVYKYEDGQFGSLMTGTITVVNIKEQLAARLPVELAECAPGCPLWAIGNGQCLEACNVDSCDFDAGDCACSSASCACFPGQAKSPEGECCEPETVGKELLFSFKLQQYGALGQTQSSFLPDPNFLKDRIYNFKNRLLIGVLLHQTRGTQGSCGLKRFSKLQDSCLDKGSSLTPYGVDPVFLPTSVLFDPAISVKNFYLDPAELTPLGVPLGFFHHKTKGYADGFPVVFDINLSNEQAIARLQYLEDGFYIDNSTKSLFVQIVTYNGEQQQFTNTEVEVTFQDGGRLAVQSSISSVSMELYHSTSDWARAVLEWILFCAITYQLCRELREFVMTMHRTNRLFGYFDDSWNYVDLISLVLLFACAILWISNYLTQCASFQVNPRYNVYKDLETEANFWELNNGGLELDTAISKFVQIHQVNQFRSEYMAINGISLFFIMLRVLKFLDFQPRMGIITRSISLAAPAIANFFLLLSIIFIIYSLQAHLVFGRSLDAYRSLAISMVTNFQIIIGDTSVNSDLLLLQGWELAAGQIFFWTFISFVTFILMNFLIAIVVDAFVEAKGNSDTAMSMPAEVWDITREYVEGLWRGGVSDKRLHQQLTAWRKRNRLTSTLSMSGGPQKPGGILASVMDRFTSIKQGEMCVRVPTGESEFRQDGTEAEMRELDYETVLAILERSKEHADAAAGNGDASESAKKGLKKEVIPDIATRSIFMRFGETRTNVQKSVEKVEEKKKVGRDAQMLKSMLEQMSLSLASVSEQVKELKESQRGLNTRLKSFEQTRKLLSPTGEKSLHRAERRPLSPTDRKSLSRNDPAGTSGSGRG